MYIRPYRMYRTYARVTYARLTYARIAYSIECLLPLGLPVYVELSLLYYRVTIHPFTKSTGWRLVVPPFVCSSGVRCPLPGVARRGGR